MKWRRLWKTNNRDNLFICRQKCGWNEWLLFPEWFIEKDFLTSLVLGCVVWAELCFGCFLSEKTQTKPETSWKHGDGFLLRVLKPLRNLTCEVASWFCGFMFLCLYFCLFACCPPPFVSRGRKKWNCKLSVCSLSSVVVLWLWGGALRNAPLWGSPAGRTLFLLVMGRVLRYRTRHTKLGLFVIFLRLFG